MSKPKSEKKAPERPMPDDAELERATGEGMKDPDVEVEQEKGDTDEDQKK